MEFSHDISATFIWSPFLANVTCAYGSWCFNQNLDLLEHVKDESFTDIITGTGHWFEAHLEVNNPFDVHTQLVSTKLKIEIERLALNAHIYWYQYPYLKLNNFYFIQNREFGKLKNVTIINSANAVNILNATYPIFAYNHYCAYFEHSMPAFEIRQIFNLIVADILRL